MPYRVEVAEPLLKPLQPRMRTRVWLALAKVAQHAERAPSLVQAGDRGIPLGEGYCASYQVDAGRRTVVLTGVDLLDPPGDAPLSAA